MLSGLYNGVEDMYNDFELIYRNAYVFRSDVLTGHEILKAGLARLWKPYLNILKNVHAKRRKKNALRPSVMEGYMEPAPPKPVVVKASTPSASKATPSTKAQTPAVSPEVASPAEGLVLGSRLPELLDMINERGENTTDRVHQMSLKKVFHDVEQADTYKHFFNPVHRGVS